MLLLNLAGTIGKDAELRRTQGGDPVASFSVAIDNGKDKQGNKRDTTWIDCSLWGKRGEALSQYLTKGSRVAVSGRPTVREYNGKAYQGVSVNEITLMGSGGRSSGGESQGGYDQPPQGNSQPAPSDLEDEIPF